MQKIDLTKIEVLPSGELALYPSVSDPAFQYVYRSAVGVYWDNDQQRFYTKLQGYNATDISYYTWYQNIISAVSSELGADLTIRNTTQWANMPEEQKNQIIALKS